MGFTESSAVLPLAHDFSKLEATIIQEKPAPRPNSIIANDVARHKNPDGLVMVDEFEHLDYGLATEDWALSSCKYMSDVLPAVQFHSCLAKPNNFGGWTQIQCLKIAEARPGELPLCSASLPTT
jgi:hypothetical protein